MGGAERRLYFPWRGGGGERKGGKTHEFCACRQADIVDNLEVRFVQSHGNWRWRWRCSSVDDVERLM